ncbi:MAG: glutathione S-transferase family protein [Deltaproteobacteria bacterium]|nr:glutathione S-transferase family protein [Deltaproteobacteria bacterium]
MLTLFKLPGAGLCPSLSPPCVKLETWLRMTGVPYDVAPGDTSAAPKRKLPYIQDGDLVLGDSTLVLDHLRARYHVDPDRALGPRDRMTGLAFRRLLKEHLYWIIVFFRWQVEAGYEAYRDLLGSAVMPAAAPDVRRAVIDGFRPLMLQQLASQGVGRHAPDEVASLGAADLAALATMLEPGPYAFGETPTTLDATIYGSICNILDVAVDSPLRDAVRTSPTLVDHCARMQVSFFPELAAAA